MAEENLFDAVRERLQFDLDKLKGNELEKIEVDSFNLSDFWSQFGAAVQGLSNEVTKVSFVCGKKPFPKKNEMAAMLQDLVQCYTVMRDFYLVLPEEVGAVVYQAVTTVVFNIMDALINFVNSLEDLSEKGAKGRLTLTGTFWDACNDVQTLPRNNLLATLNIIDEETALAIDAHEELITVNQAMRPETHTNRGDIGTKTKLQVEDTMVSELYQNKICNNGSKGQFDVSELPESHIAEHLLEQNPDVSELPESHISEHLPEQNPDVSELPDKQDTDLSKIHESHISENLPEVTSEPYNGVQGKEIVPGCSLSMSAETDPQHQICTKENSPCENNYKQFKDWVEAQIVHNKPVKLTTLQTEIDGACNLLQILENNPNDAIFQNLTSLEKLQKHTRLKEKLSELLNLKQTLDREPELLDQILANSEKSCVPKIKDTEDILSLSCKSTTDATGSTVKPISQLKKWLNVMQKNEIPILSPNAISDYLDYRNWVCIQEKLKLSPNMATLEVEIAQVGELYLNTIDTLSDPTITPTARKIKNKKRGKLTKKLKKLLMIGLILEKFPLQSVMTNNLTDIRSTQVGENQMKCVNDYKSTTQTAKTTVTTNQNHNLNVGLRLDYSNTPKHIKYDHNVKRKADSQDNSGNSNNRKQLKFETVDGGHGEPRVRQVSGLAGEEYAVEKVQMLLPALNFNCTYEFLTLFNTIQAADVIHRIRTNNPELYTERWRVHEEWRDDKERLNVLLGMDKVALRALQDLGFKARVNHQYFAHFKKLSDEFSISMLTSPFFCGKPPVSNAEHQYHKIASTRNKSQCYSYQG